MSIFTNRCARSLLAVTAAAALLGGCHSMGPGAKRGAAIGSLIGAGAGWAIGANNGHATLGAATGALLGGVVGTVIGDSHDASRGYHGPVIVHRYEAPRRVVYRTVPVYVPATTYTQQAPPRVVYHQPYRGAYHHPHHGAVRAGRYHDASHGRTVVVH